MNALFGVLMLVFIAGAILAGLFSKRIKKGTRIILQCICIPLAVVFLFFTTAYVQVEAGHVLLVKQMGKPVDVRGPGPTIVIPIYNETVDYSTMTIQIERKFEVYSSDAQRMNAILVVQYSIDPTKVIEIAQTYGTQDMLETKITQVIEERAKTVFSSRKAMTIIENRATMGGVLHDAVSPLGDNYYIHISVVVANDIKFSPTFEESVELKMVAEQEMLRADFEKQRAIIQAEAQKEVAVREAEAVVARANGDAEALTIMQQAWSSLGPEVKEAMLRQQFYERWNGVLPQVLSGGDLIYSIK